MQLSPVALHVRDNLANVGTRVYVAPSIPARKLNNAVSSIANGEIRPDEVIGIADITLWGSANDGFVFTNDTMFMKPFMEPNARYPYSEVQSVTRKGSWIHVTTENGNSRRIDTGVKDGDNFLSFLNRLIEIAKADSENTGSAAGETPAAPGSKTVARCSGCNAKFSGIIGTVTTCEWCRKPVKFEAPQ